MHSVSDNTFFGAHTGTTVGAHKWVKTLLRKKITEPLEEYKRAGHQIVAADVCANSKDYRQEDFTKPTTLVLGAELEGEGNVADPNWPLKYSCLNYIKVNRLHG